MKIKRNLNQQAAEGGGAAQQESLWGGIDTSKIEVVRNEEPTAGEAGEEGGESGEQGAAGAEGAEAAAAAQGAEGEKPTPDPKKEGEEGGETGEAGETAGEEDVLPILEEAAEAEPETTWEDLGKAFELPDVDPKLTGQERFAAQLKAKEEAAYKRGQEETQKADLQKFAPQAQVLFNAVNAGLDMAKILTPAAEYYQAASAPDADLLMDYHTINLKQTKEIAEDQVNIMIANGTAKTEADKIRAALYAEANKITQGEIKKYADMDAAEKTRIQNEIAEDNKRIAAEIRSRSEFMGGKLTPEVQNQMIKMWESGQTKNLMKNDPKAVVDFMLFNAYGPARYAKMKEAAANAAKKETFQKLSNSKSTPGGSAQKRQSDAKDFSEWAIPKGSKVEVVHGKNE